MVIAALCFLIVLAAIGWGIYEVYQIGHPAPTLPNDHRPDDATRVCGYLIERV